MLEQHARVVHCSEQGVWVKASDPTGCGVCAGGGCASRRIAELFQRIPRQYQVESRFPIAVGDEVIVGLPNGSLTHSTLHLYGLPLAAVLLGAGLAQWVWANDAGAVAGALVGLMLAGAWIIYRSSRSLSSSRPSVIRRGTHVLILEDDK
ncbi:MAG: SoxR reducing system RseC family protein [Thiobacillus sp.]